MKKICYSLSYLILIIIFIISITKNFNIKQTEAKYIIEKNITAAIIKII